MGDRLDRLHARSPLFLSALTLGLILAAERVAFATSKNLLPPLEQEFGHAAGYVPFAMGVGGTAGFALWIFAGTRAAGRGWALVFSGALVVAGIGATVAHDAWTLIAACSLAGLTGFGGSILTARTCEALVRDSARRELNHRSNTIAELTGPALLAAVTLVADRGGWRDGMALGAALLPALVLAALLFAHLGGLRERHPRPPAVELGPALQQVREQWRQRPLRLGAGASAASYMALVPFTALFALALQRDGIGLGVVGWLTLLGMPAVVVGHVWERLFGHRPRVATIAGYLPAFVGWGAALLVETAGEQWPTALRIALWGLASVAIRLALFTTNLVARGVVLSVGDGMLPAGAISVRSAMQGLPAALAATVALLAAPPLLRLGGGLWPLAVAGIALLTISVLLMHRAHHPHDHHGGDHDG